MCLITASCDPSLLRWCCPQTCPPIYSKSKRWRPACNNKNGNVDGPPFKLRAAQLRFCRMNVQSSWLTFAAHGGKLVSRWLALFVLKHVWNARHNKNKNVHHASANRIDKPKALSLLLHTADISHPSKPWALHSRWTKALMEEFFRQVGALLDVTVLFPSFLLSSSITRSVSTV